MRILFLQGNATPFFPMLGAELVRRGHQVCHVAINGGDRLFWRCGKLRAFRRRPAAWPKYFSHLVSREHPDAIVLFGEWRPFHRDAIAIANIHNIPVWIFDEGYIRPGWIRMELATADGRPSFPTTPDAIMTAAPSHAGPLRPVQATSNFAYRAIFDVIYHFFRLGSWMAYPFHRFHAPVSPYIEYIGYINKFIHSAFRFKKKRDDARIIDRNRPYILFPMQLDGDYQVRLRSPFNGNFAAIGRTLTSFKKHAPPDLNLIFKLHPLDNGLVNWRETIMEQAKILGVSERVHYVETDTLEELVDRSSGVVTINSTVGFFALGRGKPVKTLGSAVYDIPRLTCQTDLDEFWNIRPLPDHALVEAFQKLVITQASAPGAFFSKKGLRQAVRAAADRIENHGPNI